MTKLLRNKGPIALIAAILFLSAGVRVFTSASMVQAADTPAQSVREAEAARREKDELSMERLLSDLLEREAKLDEREEKFKNRMSILRDAETRFSEKLASLKAAEKKLRDTMALAQTIAEDDLARLTAVYENMKPKDAAALFEQMEPDFAAGFLGRMRPDSAADIMSGLTPQIAYSISAVLAGRNSQVPREEK